MLETSPREPVTSGRFLMPYKERDYRVAGSHVMQKGGEDFIIQRREEMRWLFRGKACYGNPSGHMAAYEVTAMKQLSDNTFLYLTNSTSQ